ncbi:MAG TPA: hypothetical protein DEF89_15480 [Desulfosporosinus sp.]|nr:hypothetical protein [Desulfosporosinus sp.]
MAGVSESLFRGHKVSITEPQGPVYICFDTTIQEQEMLERPNNTPIGGAALAYRNKDTIILNLQSDGDFLFTPSNDKSPRI